MLCVVADAVCISGVVNFNVSIWKKIIFLICFMNCKSTEMVVSCRGALPLLLCHSPNECELRCSKSVTK